MQVQSNFQKGKNAEEGTTVSPKSSSSSPLDNAELDSDYQESNEEPDEKIKAPQKNQISQAIYNKYVQSKIIEEDEQDDVDQDSAQSKDMVLKQSIPYAAKEAYDKEQVQKKDTGRKIVGRLKNLDTGQEEIIYEDDSEEEDNELRSSKLTEGLSVLGSDGQKNGWDHFWRGVQANNEKLRQLAESGMYEEAEKLLKEGGNGHPVEINHRHLDDWTALHYACYEGHDDMAELLLENGADVNALTKFRRSSLHIATLRGGLSVVKVLYRFKVAFDVADLDGNTALHFAAEGGYRDIVQYLLSIYCTVKRNKEGKTPIDDCCDEALRSVFTQYGFSPNAGYPEFKETTPGPNKSLPRNKLEHQLIPRENLQPDDFIYFKLLGKGSFGEVFLVRRKNDPEEKLYAMKVLSKDKVMTKNLKRYALTQRNVMSVINHPFMAKLFFAFQTSSKLFLVMDYYPGGDLGKLISRKKNLAEQEARKYICELVLAFEALHKNMIVFRDLKPDNVVIDADGHCRLTDFGLSKEGIYNNTTESFCGSVAYLAPEILSKQGHSRTVDWYLLGLVLYQLIVGLPPYYNSKKEVLFENIKRGPLKIPKSMTAHAKDLIKKLLCRDPRKRLGANKDSQQIKQHPFFEGIDWQDVFNRKLEMPPIEDPKINLNDPIKVTFLENQNGKKIDGWTFINKV